MWWRGGGTAWGCGCGGVVVVVTLAPVVVVRGAWCVVGVEVPFNVLVSALQLCWPGGVEKLRNVNVAHAVVREGCFANVSCVLVSSGGPPESLKIGGPRNRRTLFWERAGAPPVCLPPMSARRAVRSSTVDESDADDESPDVEGAYSVAPPQPANRLSEQLRLTTPRRSKIALLCGCLAGLITVLNVLSIWPLLQGPTESRVRACTGRPLPDCAAARLRANPCSSGFSDSARLLSGRLTHRRRPSARCHRLHLQPWSSISSRLRWITSPWVRRTCLTDRASGGALPA